MIISGGENIYPKEIEDVLAEHDAIAEVAVIGVPDPVYEERAIAVVRLHAGAAASEDELRAFVRDAAGGLQDAARGALRRGVPAHAGRQDRQGRAEQGAWVGLQCLRAPTRA